MLKIKSDFSWCTVIEVLLVLCIIIGTIIQDNILISTCFALSFVVLLAYFFIRIPFTKFNLNTLLIVFSSVICVLLNLFLSEEALLGFDYFKKMFMFFAFCLMFLFASEDSVSNKCRLFISRVTIFSAVILVISYYLDINPVKPGKSITLGFTNPNFTGQWLLHFCIYAFLMFIDKKEKIILRLLGAILLPVLVYLITLTKARSCLVGIVSFGVFCLLFCLFRSKRIRNAIAICGLSFPLLFSMSYQYLLKQDWFHELFAFFTFKGKELESRLEVWLPAINSIKDSFLIGDYSGISEGTGASQMHNIHLDVISSYGIIVGALFMLLLISKAFQIIKETDSAYQCCAFCGFLAIIISCTFEAAVVAGSMGMNILTALMIVMAKRSPTEAQITELR